MAVPNLPTITNSEADALEAGGTDTEFGTNIPYVPDNQAVGGSPQKLHTLLTQRARNLARVADTAGRVMHSENGGLNIAVFPLEYEIGATAYSYGGENSVALTDAATNYVYLDGSATVKLSTSAFPANVWLLAVVVTAGGAISSIADARPRNAQVGVINVWSGIPATQDVPMAGFGFEGLGKLDLEETTVLTVAGGVITPTQMNHKVSGEGGASDTLDTITAVAGERKFLLLAGNAQGTVTLSKNGNIRYNDPAPKVTSATDHILLYQHTDTHWVVIAPDRARIDTVGAHINFQGGPGIGLLGMLQFGGYWPTIASGAISIDSGGGNPASMVIVDTEAAASTDDLDSATGGMDRQLLFLSPAHTDRTVVVKHAGGADKFLLANGLDFAMTSTKHSLLCRYDGTQWVELFRSPMDIADLVGTSQAIPFNPGDFFVEGTLTASVFKKQIFWKEGGTIVSGTGRVPTGDEPSGGTLYVDVQVNGGSIFASDSERIKLLDGTVQGTSATVAYVVPPSSWIQIEVLGTAGSPHGAANLTVSLACRVAPVTPP